MDCTWILYILPQLLLLLTQPVLSGLTLTYKEMFDDICERYWEWRLKEFPTFATVQKNHNYDHVLEDFSLETFDRRKEAADTFHRELDTLPKRELSKSDRINLAVLSDELDYFREGHNWRMYGALTPLNFLEGIQRPPSWVKHMRFNTEEDYEKYFSRMRAVETMINQGIFLMKRAIELNRTNHEVSMHGVPEQIEEGLLCTANETMYSLPLTRRMLTRFNESFKAYVIEKGFSIIKNVIQPVYIKLRDFIRNVYSHHTRQHYGVGQFTNGLDYYHACLKFHLSSNVNASEVREIGLREVARIKADMEEIMRREGFDGKLSHFVEHLRETRREEFFDRTADELLDEFRDIIHLRIEPKLNSVIKDIPQTPVRIDSTSTDGPLALYFPSSGTFAANVRNAENRVEPMPYDGPSGSYGSGTFYANLRRSLRRPTFTMMALALHEANPGHHLQITYANEQPQPDFRRVLWGTKYYAVPYNFPWYTAYTEGWGLYAEYLGEEMGLYNKTALELFGRYSSEIFRACRLVVDTGIHAFGMSRDEAINYIAEHTAMPRSQIEKEVDRYITWPGQACAYKMGELEILRLRNVAEKELGNTFDVKEFNSEVLKAGRVPLHLLEKSIEEWINHGKVAASLSAAPPTSQLWINYSTCVLSVYVWLIS